MQYYIHGVSHCRQRISSSMKFSISIDTDPGITDTIGTIRCPLSSAPDGGCLSYELVALPGWRQHVWPQSHQSRHGSEIAKILRQSWRG